MPGQGEQLWSVVPLTNIHDVADLIQILKVAIIYGHNWMASTAESWGGRKRLKGKIVSMIIKTGT